jgi:hypothetical protein
MSICVERSDAFLLYAIRSVSVPYDIYARCILQFLDLRMLPVTTCAYKNTSFAPFTIVQKEAVIPNPSSPSSL